ncbi:MAG: GAP family protein [Cyanobacteriota bacterium]|nr:GAP family protein [Cyanobacteriota bacterium]
MDPLSFGTELLGFALAIGFSPLHIGLLLLLLLGNDPLRRGGWLVAGWCLTSALMLLLLLSLGHGFLLTMQQGTRHRTGLDLLAAGALLAIALNELLKRPEEGALPAWTARIETFGAMPLLPLLGLSSLIQVASPDDLFLYAKASASLLEAGLRRLPELLLAALFALATALLLLLPLGAVLLLGRERSLPALQGLRQWLFRRGDALVGAVSLALALYLGWQGIEGLRLA